MTTTRTRERFAPLPGMYVVTVHDAFAPFPVMGLDMSYTSAGVAVLYRDRLMSYALTQGKYMRGAERLEWFFDTIGDLSVRYQPALTVIEDYAFDAKFGREQSGELGGVTRLALHRAGMEYEEAGISQLKKFATGVGNCDKSIVARELYKRYGSDAVGNDESDACGLALMAAAKLGYDVPSSGFKVTLTAKQLEAVDALGKPPVNKTRKK